MTIKEAKVKDQEAIYMMGFDVWSDGLETKAYLALCHNSPKYKKGTWFVLTNASNKPISSLITYQFSARVFGIGSLATPKELRGNGNASKLLSGIATRLEKDMKAKAIFLFADIRPEFYERYGFKKLPNAFQEYSSSVCMVRSTNPQSVYEAPEFKPPSYF